MDRGAVSTDDTYADCPAGLEGTYHIGVVQSIRISPALNLSEYCRPSRQPEEEHHGLENQRSLVVVEVKLLGVVAAEVAKQVDEQDYGAEEIQDGGKNGMPESLGVDFSRRHWGCVDVHRAGRGDELVGLEA